MIDKNVRNYLLLYGASVAFANVVDGPWRRWSREAKNFNGWTAMHLLWGGIAYKFDLSLNQTLALSVLNEAVELWLRKNHPVAMWGDPESKLNVAIDVAANAGGWLAARKLLGE